MQPQLGAATSRATAERAADAVLAAVKRGLRGAKDVSLVGRGVLAVAARPARCGLNPNTKTPVTIRAMKTARLKAGAELRAVNGVRVMRWFLVRRGVWSGLG